MTLDNESRFRNGKVWTSGDFIYLFTNTFTEKLICAQNCAGHWGYRSKEDVKRVDHMLTVLTTKKNCKKRTQAKKQQKSE